jgi:hypothetical protein
MENHSNERQCMLNSLSLINEGYGKNDCVFDKITLETTIENQANYLSRLTIVKDNKMNKI